ncbi:protein containing TonB-dependent receptor, plug domain protein, partial [human gut metagenome]
GYESQEVAVGTKTVINITFASDNVQLDDVVVVGYGTMRKKDVTGSIAKVNMDEKATFANTNVLQSLQGAIPGLNIGMTTGAGTEPEMTVRSTTSISASNNPLVVVDGAIYNGSVSDFAPSDIQSVDVLKDASSAAVYGSRAANGVIMITTRMGSTEKPTIRVNSYVGRQYEQPT